MYRGTRDSLDSEIKRVVDENKGIRLAELSRKLNKDFMTIRYRVLEMAFSGELEIERGRGTFRVYPGPVSSSQETVVDGR